MLKLVLAEKPSVGGAISKAVGARTRSDGFYEGNGYVVTWCIGHLVQEAMPEAYDPKYAKWKMEDLPIIPETWKHEAKENTMKQLETIKTLMARKDVGEIVNACDAGREGELIARLVYNYNKCKKPLKRLWISSLEESAIKEGMATLRDGKDYDGLYHAAECRSKADWIVGLNYTRAYSVLYNSNLSLGRVQTPTLAMIVERELKIKNFVREPLYTVTISGTGGDEGFTASREKTKDKKEAESVMAKCHGRTATVEAIEVKEKSEKAPPLYDLTTLQREANRLFGHTAKETLDAAQSLYDRKMLTYPRTDSKYITDDMAHGIPGLVSAIAGNGNALPYPVSAPGDGAGESQAQEGPGNETCGVRIESVNVRAIVDNKKVTDHHAILPTLSAAKLSKKDIDGMKVAERDVLQMTCTRLLAATSDMHEYAETSVAVLCEGETFNAKGRTVRKQGFKSIEQAYMLSIGRKKEKEGESAPMPELAQGQQLRNVNATVKEGQTSPPAHYTEDTLLQAMENAGKEEMPDDAERKGIGTPATRHEAIETLIKRDYAARDKKNLLPTEKGFNLIKALPDEDAIKTATLTAKWEHDLKRVEKKEISAGTFMASIEKYIRDVVAMLKAAAPQKEHVDLFSNYGSKAQGGKGSAASEAICPCPRCGKSIVESAKAFGCEDRGCSFALFKGSKFFETKKKALTKDIAKKLIIDGKAKMEGLHSPKTGKTYNATIVLRDDGEAGKYPSFKMEFGNGS